MSLVSFLVGIAILGIGIVIFSQLMANKIKLDNKISASEDLEDIRHTVRIRLDCTKTVTPTPAACASNAGIDAKQKDGSAFLVLSPVDLQNYMGKYNLRARCIAVAGNKHMVTIEYRREDPATKEPIFDPLTGGESTWTNLFASVPVCVEF
jgi:hypothetical protein